MPELNSQKIVARQVERIVRQLTSLSTLPAVAGDLLGQLHPQATAKLGLAIGVALQGRKGGRFHHVRQEIGEGPDHPLLVKIAGAALFAQDLV